MKIETRDTAEITAGWRDRLRRSGISMNTYIAEVIARENPELDKPQHGVTCKKEPHMPGRTGYLHDADDDRPYDVDGVMYCGRCHWAL